MLIKISIIVVIALIGGTLMVNPHVDAAPSDQGKPFESLWNAIDNLGQTLGMTSCDDGQVVKWDDASGEWICSDYNGAAHLHVQTFEGDLVEAKLSRVYRSTADCPAGTIVTGGGYKFSTINSDIEGIIIENAQLNDQQWRVQFKYDSDGSGIFRFKATVNCASMIP